MARKPLEEIKKQLPSYITIDEYTYKNAVTKARFVDEKYGEWWALPRTVLRGHDHKLRGLEKSRAYGQSLIIPIDVVKSRLPFHIEIDESTYTHQKAKCRFIDKEYGQWLATPDNIFQGKDHPARRKAKTMQAMRDKYGFDWNLQSPVIKKRIEKTNLKKYGCKNPSQNAEISRRNARSQTKRSTKIHWKTGKEIHCVGSYEVAVVDYLNINKIDYRWQPTAFEMPDSRVYIPDCYLIDEDIWVEIKGYFRDKSKEKWNWFHTKYLNSELWDKKVLIAKGVKFKGNSAKG
jgi:hypothetical protein